MKGGLDQYQGYVHILLFCERKLCTYLCNEAKRPKAGVYAPDFLQYGNIAFEHTVDRIPSGNVCCDGMGTLWGYRMTNFCAICSLRYGHGQGRGHDLAFLSCFLLSLFFRRWASTLLFAAAFLSCLLVLVLVLFSNGTTSSPMYLTYIFKPQTTGAISGTCYPSTRPYSNRQTKLVGCCMESATSSNTITASATFFSPQFVRLATGSVTVSALRRFSLRPVHRQLTGQLTVYMYIRNSPK